MYTHMHACDETNYTGQNIRCSEDIQGPSGIIEVVENWAHVYSMDENS